MVPLKSDDQWCESHVCRETTNKNFPKKHGYLTHTWSYKAFNGTFESKTCCFIFPSWNYEPVPLNVFCRCPCPSNCWDAKCKHCICSLAE